MRGPIQITVDLEQAIREELAMVDARAAAASDLEAVEELRRLQAKRAALRWVLERAGIEP